MNPVALAYLRDTVLATIGIACVSNDGAHVNRVLDKVLDTIESNPSYDVGEVEMEML